MCLLKGYHSKLPGMKSPKLHVLYCKHSQFHEVKGDLTNIICTAVNKVTSGQAIGAQKMRGVWAIIVRCNEARETLCQTGIEINDAHIPLHLENPYSVHKVEGERVTIKDWPIWEDDSLLTEYLRAHPNVGEFSKIYKSTSRNSKFYNGDRFVYVQLNPNAHPPIAPRIKVGDFSCRVQFSSMNAVCERCRKQGHHTHDTSKCEAYEAEQPNVHFFTQGILSNFEPCPVTFQGIQFITSEHAYQWSACVEDLRDDLAEEVIMSKSPLEAKKIASAVKSDSSNWHKIKFSVMEKVLRSKAESSEEFRSELLATGDKVLIEARQDLWWGSGLSYRITTTTNPKYHPGHSWLGKILMKIRSDLISDNAMNIPELSEQDVSTNACLPREPRAPIKRGRNTHQTKGRSASSSEIKIRSMSLSPSRIQSLKGAKFDTPLLKDFLRKQAKHTRTQSDSLSNINIASTQNVPIGDDTQVTNL